MHFGSFQGRGIRRVGTLLSTSFDAGVDLRDVQIAARYADPRTTMRYDGARKTLIATRTTSSPPTWLLAPDRTGASRATQPEKRPALPKVMRADDAW